MAQIVLISPYSGIEATGLRILSACLKQAGFETRMIFLPDITEAMAGAHYNQRVFSPEVFRQIADLCADAVLAGITVMSSSFYIARQITQHLHAGLEIPVIWGGIHPTVCPQECLRYADIVCIGEGEFAIVKLAQRIAAGDDYYDVNNLASLNNQGEIVINPLHPLEQNLDKLPFPDYEFGTHYVLHGGEVIQFTQRLMHYYLTDLGSWAPGPIYGVLTTRGCPYRCTYCANNAFANIYPGWSKLRRRSPDNVIAEIQAVRERLPSIEAINIRDDTFFANPKSYISEFCQRYREVSLPFRAYTTAQTADSTKLGDLVEAGLRFVVMGIQTGSGRTKKLYQRHVSNEQILRAAHLVHDFQTWIPRPMYDVITDNPYEDDNDRFETLQLIHRLPPPYRLSLFSLTFYPGTDLAARGKQDGLIGDEEHRIYEYNFQIIEPNYYNFALFCHSLNLPRWFLFILTRRSVFNILSREPMSRFCGWLLEGLLTLRLWKNQRLYSRRRQEWLSQDQAEGHA
jgi:anaerobic magnesium-protoporphyrin IX monomethyl ester cyclase